MFNSFFTSEQTSTPPAPPTANSFVTGGYFSSDFPENNLFKYDLDGEELVEDDFPAFVGAIIWNIESDNNGNIYVTHDKNSTNDYTCSIFNNKGELINGIVTDSGIRVAKIDNNGYLILGGETTGGDNIFKYDLSDNSLVWSQYFGATIFDLDIDSNNDIIAVGIKNNQINSTFSNVRKYNGNNGNLLWSDDTGVDANLAIKIASNNDYYIGAFDDGDTDNICKFDGPGSKVWGNRLGPIGPEGMVRNIIFDSNNNLLVTPADRVYRVDSSNGSIMDTSASNFNTIYDLDYDGDKVYVVGPRTNIGGIDRIGMILNNDLTLNKRIDKNYPYYYAIKIIYE